MNPSSAQIDLSELARPLMRRIENGSEFLFDLEQRGETSGDYERWVAGYAQLVRDYTILTERMILGGQASIEAVAPVVADPASLAGQATVCGPEDPEQAPLLLGADAPPARERSLVEGF